MLVNIISTGSHGNCVVVDDSIMLDAGITRKKVLDSGYALERLKLVFVSHKHSDHTNLPLIRYCIENGVEVHIPRDVLAKLIKEGRIDVKQYTDNIFIHEDQDKYTRTINGVTYHITLHPQRHHDIVNYAFVLEKGQERLLYATDLDTVNPSEVGPGLLTLGLFDVIMLEGNYDESWLREYITTTIYALDPYINTLTMSADDLNTYVRQNYRQIPTGIRASLFRAVQNMRHLSKQQARAYVIDHLKPGGVYYEIHRSSTFYERPLHSN